MATSTSGHDGTGEHDYDHLRLFEATATANIDGVTISDVTTADYPLVYVNPGFEVMTGYTAEEVIGRNCRFLQGNERDESTLERIREALRNEEPCRVTLRNFRKDGTLFWNELTMYPLRNEEGELTHYVGIQRDVTERKKLEAQFLQAQRMDSIGRLAGGIAHDLGNLLVPVLIGAKRLMKKYADDEKALRTLSLIHESGERGAEMVKQVLAFARGIEGQRAPLQPNKVVGEVEKIITETFPADIKLELHVPEKTWSIEGDSTQIQQILVNLCVNARDAMPDGGVLTLQTENVEVDDSMARMILDSRPGKFVCFSVSDTGTGMPVDIRDKVFEPFFTTKPMGAGTGLGLSTVYNIVKSHSGFLTLYSEEGHGTTFNIYLPFSEKEAPKDTPVLDAAENRGQGRLVLVVDDERFILESAEEALTDVGYEVQTAANGKIALEVYDASEGVVHAAVIDLMMPEMDGLSAMKALHERNPNLPIVAASGLGKSREKTATEAGASVFLSKPYTAAQLYEALDQAIDAFNR